MSGEVTRWRTFAGVMFYLVGAFNTIGGLLALFKDEVFGVGSETLPVSDYTAWGTLLLVLGLVQLAVGVGIFAGKTWGRVLGVVLAFLSAVFHIAFLVAFPIFGLITIGLSVAVIYGLIVQAEPEPGA
jgi:hypothetical protein